MTLTSKSVAISLLVMIFGGIAFASAMGWWATESTKVPITFTEGEFAGQANPADIRGSYTFGDIASSFDVTPEVLAQAFGVQEGDPAGFTVKDLEGMYLASEYEIGTTSVRLFVAYYTGLPFDTTDQEIYLPQSAFDILLDRGNLTSERIAYLEKHTVIVAEALNAEQPVAPVRSASAKASPPTTERLVKGKTTFGEMILWGVPQPAIEELIGGPMPDPAMTLKDYASANGLTFETLKLDLQAEVDKMRP